MRHNPLRKAPRSYGAKREFVHDLIDSIDARETDPKAFDIRPSATGEWLHLRAHPKALSLDRQLYFRESLPWLARRINSPDDFDWIAAIVLDDELDAQGVNPVLGSIRGLWIHALPADPRSVAVLEQLVRRRRNLDEVSAALERLREIGTSTSLPLLDELEADPLEGWDTWNRNLLARTKHAVARRK